MSKALGLATFRRAMSSIALIVSMSCSIAAAADAPVEAIWRQQSFNFSYLSMSVRYTCPGLQHRLSNILEAVGVRQLVSMHCLGGASRAVQVQLQMQHAVEATDENVLAATSFDPTQRLLARVRNERLPSAADLPRFMARWQRIELHRERKLRFDSGDCELLQQVRKQIFPKLAVRVENAAVCYPGSATRIGGVLSVVALLPQANGAKE